MEIISNYDLVNILPVYRIIFNQKKNKIIFFFNSFNSFKLVAY